MRRRIFFTLLLTLFAAPGLASATCAAREMTEEDERGARALALRFMKRLREADDFAPLVGEFFPEDFDGRLRRAALETPAGGEDDFLFLFDRAALARAEASELRRGYVALLNFWNQRDLLGDAAFDYADLECGLAGVKRPCGWGRHFKLAREAVPGEASRIADGDPLFGALLGSFFDEETAGDGPSPEEQAARIESLMIRDAARLRAFTDGVERFVPLLRLATARLRSEAKSLAAAHGAAEEYAATVAAREELKVYYLKGETVGEADSGARGLGLPAGALLIRARVYPFEMAMSCAEGRLKILVVYPDFDGD
jgi:hypothetical protein